MKNQNFLYMAISDDAYELPIAIASTQKELAQLTGIDITYISRELKLQQQNVWSRFIKVPNEGDYLLPDRTTKPAEKKLKPIIGNGKFYASLTQAAQEHCVSVATICYWIKNKPDWNYVEKP